MVEQTITLDDYQIAGQSVPQYYSIECNERIPYQSFANTVANAQHLEIPDLALGMSEAMVKVFAVCERWPSEQAPATETQPVWSEIPTLILAGAYDNLTPVSWNKSAFETLPNGVFVLAPGAGARRHHLLGVRRSDSAGLHHRSGQGTGHVLLRLSRAAVGPTASRGDAKRRTIDASGCCRREPRGELRRHTPVAAGNRRRTTHVSCTSALVDARTARTERSSMKTHAPRQQGISRREALKVGVGAAIGGAAASLLPWERRTVASATPTAAQAPDVLFRELDAKIEAGMARYHIPGVAIGVLYQGEEYVRGYGVTNVDEPEPVDGDTLFRIASTTKTFTGTTVMRLVEQGQLDLNAPVRRYLPDFRVADEAASATVTLRQCLNHSAGWVGDDERDFGRGDDALARYIASMRELPQLTPPGAAVRLQQYGTRRRWAASSKWSPTSRTRRRCAPYCSIRSSSAARGISPMSWRATRSPAATAWSTTAPSFPPSSGISRGTGIPTAA